jgi:hypothetical protein
LRNFPWPKDPGFPFSMPPSFSSFPPTFSFYTVLSWPVLPMVLPTVHHPFFVWFGMAVA